MTDPTPKYVAPAPASPPAAPAPHQASAPTSPYYFQSPWYQSQQYYASPAAAMYAPAPPAPVTSDEGPLAPAPSGWWPSTLARVVAIVLGVLTVAALVLGALAPTLAPQSRSTVPSDWTKVYDAAPRDDSKWSTNSGCTVNGRGMDAVGTSTGARCEFASSAARDLVSRGFYIEATLVAAGSVEGNQQPAIIIGSDNAVTAAFDQSGNYVLCTNSVSMSCANQSGASGSTIAWHADGYVGNTIGLRYLPATEELTLYANGQQIATQTGTVPSGSPLALGALVHSEALFTHVTIYAASAG